MTAAAKDLSLSLDELRGQSPRKERGSCGGSWSSTMSRTFGRWRGYLEADGFVAVEAVGGAVLGR